MLVLRRHRGRIMILRRCLHRHVGLHVRRRHVWCVRHGRNQRRASGRLWRVGVLHVARLGLESWRHTTSLARSIAELVIRRVSHLVIVRIVVRVEVSSSTATLGREAATVSSTRVVALDRVARVSSEMRAGLRRYRIRVGRNRTLSHVSLYSQVSFPLCARIMT